VAKTKLPLLIVTWDDAWGDSVAAITEKDAHEQHRPEVIHTIGWAIFEDNDGISLVSEICEDGTYRGRSFIPHGMIKDRQEFTLRKKSHVVHIVGNADVTQG
jgi:hypothetical protein